jgi:hypothetical protein
MALIWILGLKVKSYAAAESCREKGEDFERKREKEFFLLNPDYAS